ncbi:MAG: PAS domain S-box protein [Nitrospirae bacterium]|nr:PAS domain S-box protein [Nitrospirota bacterium]
MKRKLSSSSKSDSEIQGQQPRYLRKAAEELLKSKKEMLEKIGEKDTGELLHELLVHQVKLEMQNEEFRRTRKEIEKTIDAIEDPLFLLDMKGEIIRCNKAMTKYVGKPFEEIIGQNYKDVLKKESDIIERCFFSLRETNYREAAIFKKGTRWFNLTLDPMMDEANSLVGAVCIISDITERKQAEEESKRLSLFLQNLIDAIPAPVFYKDSRGVYLGCNTAFQEYLGLRKDQIIGKTVYDVAPKELAEIYEQRDKDLFESKGKQIYESSVKYSDGTKHDVVFFKETFLNEDSSLGGLVGVILDITERKQMEELLRKSHDELEIRVQERTSELQKAHKDIEKERERLYDVLETLPAYVVLLTPDYHVPFANRFFRDRFGESRGRRCFEYLFGRNKPCEICETYTVLKSMKPHEWDWIGPDGRNYHVYDYPFTDIDGSSLILEMGIDITDLKWAEKALEKSHELLESAFSNIHILVAQLDMNFNFIRVNKAYAQADGRDPEFFAGKNHFDLYPHEENEAVFRKVVQTGEPVTFYGKPFEYAEHPERGVTYWDWNLQPVKDETGNIESLVLSLIDRTEDYRSRESLIKSESKYRSLIEQAADAIAILDGQFNVIDVNTAACRMAGFSKEELLHLNAKNFLLSDDLLARPLELEKLFAGVTIRDERRITRKDGSLIDLEFSAQMLDDGSIQAIARDISGRKEAENRDRLITGLLELFIKKNSKKEYLDGVVELINEWSGCRSVGIRTVNEERYIPYESYVGFNDEFMKLENMLSLDTDVCACIRVILDKAEPQDHGALTSKGSFCLNNSLKFLNTLTEKQKTRYHGNCIRNGFASIAIIPVRYRRKTLGAIHMADERENMSPVKIVEFIESMAAPLIGEALHRFDVEAQIIKTRDELELRVEKRTAELKNLSEELKRSNADLEQFAYTASHDLQSPLKNVEGFVKLLEKRYRRKLDEKADELIEFIIEGVKNMQMLIKDLLEYSQVSTEGKRFKHVDSSMPLALALANLQSAIEENEAGVTYDDNLPKVMADFSQISRLFQNLIGNALKFRSKKKPEVHVSVERRGDEWLFSVRDNGIRINPQDSERIFAVFQRLHGKSEYTGTGVGLAICKRILERHSGRIWVESEPGKGSTFYFTMPVIE